MQAKVVEITENYVNLLRTLSNLMGTPIFNYKSFDFIRIRIQIGSRGLY